MNNETILNWYLVSGITDIINENPTNHYCQKTNKVEKKENPQTQKESFLEQAIRLSNQCTSLKEIEETLSTSNIFSIKKNAQNLFLGTGVTKNPLVFAICDAPKAAADKSGNLFTGEQGELLRKMLISIQISPENSYIAPLIPWRLPGDRKPLEIEEKTCTPFIKKQIELIKPKFILCFGSSPTRALLNFESVAKARTQNHTLTFDDTKIPTIVTFGPEMVSTSKSARQNAWDDLKKLQQLIKNNS